MPKISKQEQEEAIARLREWLKPGDIVHTILRHVSRSGMQRTIQLVKLNPDSLTGECGALHIGYNAHLAGVGSGYDQQREGIKVGGCGMDMGFALVYELSQTVFPEYECTGDRCPSNAHVNYRGDRDKEPRGGGVMHRDGYALRQRWL